MKIIHTSDWHIGRKFENIPLEEEFNFFIDWIVQTIEAEEADVLIIAGDVFDTSMPSIQAQKQYYSTLAKLSTTRLQKIIIINGNHDSANFLLAPRTILSGMKTFISAGLPQSLEDIILTLPENNPEVVIAAVPYLRDIDIINFFPETDKYSEIQKNIALFYHVIAEKTQNFKKKGIPVIATGHFFVTDSRQSEKDVTDYSLGGLIDINSSQLPETIDYYALGHVHRPWALKEKNIHYCGNPFPMSLNDIRSDIPKQINLIDTQDITNIKSIPVPLPRQIVKFSGTAQEVEEQIKNFENKGFFSPAYAVAIIEDYQGDMDKIREYLTSINTEQIKLLTTVFPPKKNNIPSNKTYIKAFENNDPKTIFSMFISQQAGLNDQEKKDLLETFDELLSIHRQKSYEE